MAKKTRTIIAFNESFEKRVYDLCNIIGIKNKNIATKPTPDCIMINIYCGNKKFDQLAFNLGISKLHDAWW